MMKRIFVAASAGILLIAGCTNDDAIKEQNAAAVPISTMVEHVAPSQGPYYYGLIEEYQRFLREDPDNLSALIGIGNAFYASGAWREAVPYYERVLAIDHRNADVSSDLGSAFRNLGMPERALKEYLRALEADPDHVGARYHLGFLYAYDFRNYRLAIHVWEDLLRIAPNHPDAYYIRRNLAMFKKTITKGHP